MARKPRILLVDEQSVINLVLRKSLEGEPYDFAIARNRDQAISLLKSDPCIDLIICDNDTAALKGALLIEVRDSLEQRRDIAIIMLASNVQGLQKANAMEGQGVYWISKPYRKQDLLGAIRRLIATEVADESVEPLAELRRIS